MASAGGVGIDIDIDRVPLREPGMEPFEIMVSESQERMLAVVEPERVEEVLAVCERWQTGSSRIGEVTDNAAIRIMRGEEVVGEMPVSALVDECPLYDLEPAEPKEWIYGNQQPGGTGREAEDSAGDVLLGLLAAPSIASKRWAFEQYDSIVGSRTVRRPESADAAVLALPEADGAIALSIDGNGRRVACDPYAGTIEAVLECAQNLACVGAEPLGLTNCLNFGNPEKPHVAWQLDRSTQGLADACEALGVPVVGGNVSLYNETERGPIYPTPVVGMVGELPDPERSGSAALRDGDAVAIIGPFAPSLAGSELAKQRGELGPGLPTLPLAIVRPAIELVREAVRAGAVTLRPRRLRRRPGGAPSPRPPSRAESAPRSTSTTSSSRAAARARPRSSARVRAASSSPASAPRSSSSSSPWARRGVPRRRRRRDADRDLGRRGRARAPGRRGRAGVALAGRAPRSPRPRLGVTDRRVGDRPA